MLCLWVVGHRRHLRAGRSLEGATIPKGPTFQRVFHFKGTTASKELLLKGTTTSKEAFGISPQVGLSERELEVSQTTFELPQFFLICSLRVLEYEPQMWGLGSHLRVRLGVPPQGGFWRTSGGV